MKWKDENKRKKKEEEKKRKEKKEEEEEKTGVMNDRWSSSEVEEIIEKN